MFTLARSLRKCTQCSKTLHVWLVSAQLGMNRYQVTVTPYSRPERKPTHGNRNGERLAKTLLIR